MPTKTLLKYPFSWPSCWQGLMTHVNPRSAPEILAEELPLDASRKDGGNELPWDSWGMEDTAGSWAELRDPGAAPAVGHIWSWRHCSALCSLSPRRCLEFALAGMSWSLLLKDHRTSGHQNACGASLPSSNTF